MKLLSFALAGKPRFGALSGDGVVDILGQRRVGQHVAVGIPIVRGSDVDQLDESHASFDQAASDSSVISQ